MAEEGGTMYGRWTRGAVLALLGAALLVGLVGGGGLGRGAAAQGVKGGPGAPATVRVITFSTPFAFAVAEGRGYFAAEGLEVEHVITQSSAQLMNGVIDGTYDIGLTNPDNWITYVVRDG